MAAPVAIQLAGAMEIAAAGGVSGGPRSPTTPVSPTGMGIQPRMPSPFVNLNVREVFERNGLEHTTQISKKVNLEIEKKKEELRTLVGERYRDLIDAADTIASMSASSATIFKNLGNLRQRMSTLPTQLNAVPRALPASSSETNEGTLNTEELEIAFELKLSLEAPRVVQKCLDEMKVISATHVSLLFDKSLCQANRPYKWTFLYSTGKDPSETMMSIQNLILKACDEMMEDFQTPPEKLAECVAAMQVLTKRSCSDIVSEFLTKRLEMSKRNLLQKVSFPKDIFVQNIAKTLQDIHIIFVDGQLYNGAVKDMRRPKITTALFGIKYCPKVVGNFNNGNITVEDSPRASTLGQLLLRYYVEPLKLLLSSCYEQDQYLIEQHSFQELNDYQKATLEILQNRTEELMRIVLGTSTSLWSEAFYPVFQRKCEQVGKHKLDAIFNHLDSTAFPNYAKLDEEFNLVDYIWKASTQKGKHAANSTTFSSNKDVDLKLKCISPQVADICGEIEQKFVEFLKDFKTLGDFSLKKYISNKILEDWNEFLNSHSKSPTLFLGRFVASLTDLCPTIWKLMDIKDSGELRSNVTLVSEKCWTEWSKSIGEKFDTTLRSKMCKLENTSVAVFMPVAEMYTPEGEDAVAPSVRVPLQISHLLHSNLFALCHDLSRVGPQSIPKRVREELRHDIGSKLINLYKELVEQVDSNVSPQTALQLIFDIKFCQWFHLQLKEQADPVIKRLQGIIDPFDMDIVSPRLKANLKRFLFETHLTIGLLFSEESHSFIAQNFKTKMNMSFPISNSALKSPLPLLPV